MVNQLAGTFGGAPFKYLADWTERVARGELPHTHPKRPEGVERNIVVTSWEWHTAKQYVHDLIASDRRNPTINAYGPLFGLVVYGVYDFTNYSTLRQWPLVVAFTDLAWGVVPSAAPVVVVRIVVR